MPDTNQSALSHRLLSIDALRGLIILFMLLDHCRETFFLHLQVSDPMDIAITDISLYLSRMLAHLCAPSFIFLTGLSAYLYGQKYSGDRRAIASFLLKRGVFLVILELTIINFAWTSQFPPSVIYLQVIWAIGLSMIALSALIWLPNNALLVMAIVIIAGHNLLDSTHFTSDSSAHLPWAILHDRGWLNFDTFKARTSYPILPWIGVISLGYYFGCLYQKEILPPWRQRQLLKLSLVFLSLFILIRAINLYGDKLPWQHYPLFYQTLMSFFNVTKYPPSLLFLLLTLAGCFALLAYLERIKPCGWLNYVSIFGSVPMFFYIIHLYLLKILYLIAVTIWGLNQGNYFGFNNMGQIWLVTLVIITLLYPLVKWFSGFKANHRQYRWLKYL